MKGPGGDPGGFATPGKKDGKSWTGVIGRQSKKVSGKQGMHHHPQMADLGNSVAAGMKPGGFAKVKGY